MESFDINKLIFGDLLDADELGKLGNVDLGIGGNHSHFQSLLYIVDDLMLEDAEKPKSALPQKRKMSEEERKSDRMSVDGDHHQRSEGKKGDEGEEQLDDGEGVKSDKDSFQVESGDESAAEEDGRLTPISQAGEQVDSDEEATPSGKKQRVQFLDDQQQQHSLANTQASQTSKGIDLPVLWRNER